MSFPRPTLDALRNQARAEVAARLPGEDAALRRSIPMVLAEALAGLSHHQYGYLDFIARQVIPDTAEGEYLDRWARLVGVPRKVATIAGGRLTFRGTDGVVVPAGTRVTRGDGASYVTVADGTIAAGVASLEVVALAGGVGSNVPAGSALTLATAMPGVLGTVTVDAGGISGGGPIESDERLRVRLRERLSNPPAGGAAHDYLAWALAVPGVTRAWVLPLNRGPGTVDLTFVMDDRENIIPLSADVAAVQAYINARKPVTADSIVFAPVPVALNVSITGLAPDTPAIRLAIAAELRSQITLDASPAGTIRRSRIIEAIGRAPGEFSHVLALPAGDVVVGTGQISVPGSVSFA